MDEMRKVYKDLVCNVDRWGLPKVVRNLKSDQPKFLSDEDLLKIHKADDHRPAKPLSFVLTLLNYKECTEERLSKLFQLRCTCMGRKAHQYYPEKKESLELGDPAKFELDGIWLRYYPGVMALDRREAFDSDEHLKKTRKVYESEKADPYELVCNGRLLGQLYLWNERDVFLKFEASHAKVKPISCKVTDKHRRMSQMLGTFPSLLRQRLRISPPTKGHVE